MATIRRHIFSINRSSLVLFGSALFVLGIVTTSTAVGHADSDRSVKPSAHPSQAAAHQSTVSTSRGSPNTKKDQNITEQNAPPVSSVTTQLCENRINTIQYKINAFSGAATSILGKLEAIEQQIDSYRGSVEARLTPEQTELNYQINVTITDTHKKAVGVVAALDAVLPTLATVDCQSVSSSDAFRDVKSVSMETARALRDYRDALHKSLAYLTATSSPEVNIVKDSDQ